ncbi:tryptophan dimethylallyltransferase family protein [Actinomadura sp. 21ATH]|uniref:tryptophan dimethylallyltransferase family protein n=1 Tax=Actinomadura sp. 21ATH TaxID=1735444 RepID=UPI0035BF7A8D
MTIGLPGPSGPPVARAPETVTLGAHLAGCLQRLRAAAGYPVTGIEDMRALHELLGAAGSLPLGGQPASASFVSDDHTPAELSVSFPGGGVPSVRVLVEPGCVAPTLAESARVGRRAVERLAERWGCSTGPLRLVEDLFLPPAPRGRFALWCALELRCGGTPGIKVYLDPLARGPEGAAAAVGEALGRLGHGRAWPALLESAASRPGDELMFFSVDLGDWAAPRVKVYVAHRGISAEGAGHIARLACGGGRPGVARFCREAAGTGMFDRRPLVSCFSFTGRDAARPTAHTVHVPVRDYVRDDREARDRAAALLLRRGVPAAPLDRALAAMTSRDLGGGVGLISYLSLVQADGAEPRLTVYLSPEAYRVRAPRTSG